MNNITIFRNRLLKIGIDVTFFGNYPWIYLDTVCSKKVTGTFQANHGFTAFFYGMDANGRTTYKMTDIKTVFNKIRETL